jgi:[protein-PII] uridylyltransferase
MKTSSPHESASKALNEKVAELTARFLKGRQPDFLKQHTRALDDYFQQAFETSMIGPRLEINRNPYAIVALGGYGREEQCVHSDVDLLFLFGKHIPPEAESLIREMIYPLWDIGLDVGYATRSVKECLALAAKDLNILTPLLDSRFLCGMSMLFTELMAQLREKVIGKRTARIQAELFEFTRSRHAKYGDSAYLLEPNLKEGQGGLRDYHTMLWMARIQHDLRQPRDLEYLGLLSHAEYQALREALGFIWHVRNHLHSLCRRKCDQLHFENQVLLAARLGFQDDADQQPVERFLGELHGRMDLVKQHYLALLHELGLERKSRGRAAAARHRPVEGIELVSWGLLNFTGPEAILKRPELLMRIFDESAHVKAPIAAEAKRLIREFAYLVDARYRSAPEIVRTFERILLNPDSAYGVLDDMLSTGFLAAFIPPFARIAHRIQYDEYHVFPVDKHLLKTLQAVKELGAAGPPAEPLAARLFREIKGKTPLLWAALLHDIGKGSAEDDHALSGAEAARRILTEKGLTAAEVDTVAFLVREHLFLVKTATRRDIHDEETAILCGRRIKTAERLKMLYILTVADSMSTGPAAWNDWTAHLLREFFFKVLNIIEKGELATEETAAAIEDKRAAVLAAAGPEERRECEALFASLSPRYLLAMPAAAISEHLRLFRRLGAAAFVWDIRPSPEGSTRTVTVCAKDRPGLVASIAGVFTLGGINILGVQVFTWKNRTALDIFEVAPPPDTLFEQEKWNRTAARLESALAGTFDLAGALGPRLGAGPAIKPHAVKRPHRVRIDNASSSFFTIVEVFTYDFPGLLYRITDALFRCGLDIWVAKIATKVDQVVDVFYVRDASGQKVDAPERVAEIERAVLARLPQMD